METESSREGADVGEHAGESMLRREVARFYLCFSRRQADSQLRCNGFKFLHLKVSNLYLRSE